MENGEVDLFGDPIVHREAKRGRPPHERTPRNANKVSVLFALGKSLKDVADALGITQPTLHKHYFHEVQQREAMALKLEAEVTVELFEQAKDGNVGAMKTLLGRLDRAGMLQLATMKGKKDPPKKAPAPLGKKAQRKQDALGIGGRFAPRSGPATAH